MATLDEVKGLLREWTGPINSKLDKLTAKFEELGKTVKFLDDKYDELLPQLKQTTEKLHPQAQSVKAAKEEMCWRCNALNWRRGSSSVRAQRLP